jgi:hypothetical protein
VENHTTQKISEDGAHGIEFTTVLILQVSGVPGGMCPCHCQNWVENTKGKKEETHKEQEKKKQKKEKHMPLAIPPKEWFI